MGITDCQFLIANLNHFDAEFFAQLSPGGGGDRLPGLAFSTRKLP
jgi:hypothetical protein